MIDILCIGHAAYDLTLPLAEYPRENEKYSIDSFMEAGGGPAANAAYLLSKWGVKTGFIGLIGDDLYGEKIVQEFEEVGTDLSLLELQRNYATPFSTILINKETGSRTIINRKIPHPEIEISSDKLKSIQPKVILLDGHELQTSLKALEEFPSALSVLDAGSLKEGTRVLAEKVDYVVASEKFAKQYCHMDTMNSESDYEECIQRLKESCAGQVVVTLGEKGLIYEREGKIVKMAAFPAKAIDTTAAGDIFHGAFAYGVFKDFSLEENLRFSSATSALSVEKMGGRQSVPRVEAVESYKASNDV